MLIVPLLITATEADHTVVSDLLPMLSDHLVVIQVTTKLTIAVTVIFSNELRPTVAVAHALVVLTVVRLPLPLTTPVVRRPTLQAVWP
jgi:hypothetical protein